LFLAPLVVFASLSQGADFIDQGTVPEPVLKTNLERLMEYVIDDQSAQLRVTQILGREAIGHGKHRIWFCIEVKRGDYEPVRNCGADARLISLDTGRWIIQHVPEGAWLVVEQ
jgi:hypothetical protein